MEQPLYKVTLERKTGGIFSDSRFGSDSQRRQKGAASAGIVWGSGVSSVSSQLNGEVAAGGEGEFFKHAMVSMMSVNLGIDESIKPYREEIRT